MHLFNFRKFTEIDCFIIYSAHQYKEKIVKGGICLILIAVLFFFFFMPEFADCKSLQEKKKAKAAEKEKPEKKDQEGEDAATEEEKGLEDKFFDLGFGFAVGVTVYRSERKSIEEAAVVNGIVRVLEEKSTTARMMLESHYFFPFPVWNKKRKIGIGPFLALEIVGKQFTTFGGGLLVGFKYSEKTSRSFNIGIGWFHDQNFKKLGDGLNRNQPTPTGEYVIRYKITGWDGPMVIFSFSF